MTIQRYLGFTDLPLDKVSLQNSRFDFFMSFCSNNRHRSGSSTIINTGRMCYRPSRGKIENGHSHRDARSGSKYTRFRKIFSRIELLLQQHVRIRKNRIETMMPFFVMLRDGDQEPDDLQQQENIYLVEFSAEYEDVGERRETAIFFYEEHHDDSKYGYVLFGDALKDLIEID
jgi:hypothetical protein